VQDLVDALELWTTTEPYRGFPCSTIAWRLIPALHHKQYRLYRDVDGFPRGFVSWAFMTEREFETREYFGPEIFARKTGELLVFVDMIAPHGQSDVLLICRELQREFRELYPNVKTAVAHRGPRTGVFPQKGG
jgi:hemolysin-activating ACP:hemolysin acyltransferase